MHPVILIHPVKLMQACLSAAATMPAHHNALLLLLGVLAALCVGASQHPTWAPPTSVHVVFGNHLDIGFDNIEPLIGYDNNVLNEYFDEYLPRAAAVARDMQAASPHGDRYVYTTHSFLISLFLDCPRGMGLQCPNSTTTAAVTGAIKSGAITWHAHPHNAQYEFYDTSLLQFSFDLTHDLDRRFGLPPKHTAILRDVPGLTRASIPVFVSRGIKAISVGVNAGSAPPGVPWFTPFLWRDEASGTQILAFWHPGGYGGMRDSLALDPREECIQAPGLSHVLCTSWRNDNSGPPEDVSEPLQIFDLLRQDWAPPTSNSDSEPLHADVSGSSGGRRKSVRVFASSFDAFVDEVLAVLPSLNLPVVTEEIGDTWVFGVQSDPLKTANFRVASRLRAACIANPDCPSDGPEFLNFSRLLLKVPEHTWGVDIKKTLHDFEDYSNTRLHGCLPPHLRPRWAPGYASSAAAAAAEEHLDSSSGSDGGSGGSSDGSSGRDGSGFSSDGSSGGSSGGNVDAGIRAPCPNYRHCIKAWLRQAAYIDWALQALPASHWVVQAYAADLRARQQLAAISPEQLLDSSTALLPLPPHQSAPQAPSDASTPGIPCRPHLASTAGKQRRQHMWWQQQQQARISEPDSRAGSGAAGAGSVSGAGVRTQAVAVTGTGVHQYWCGRWRFELDEALGGLTSLTKFHGDGSSAGTDWARGSSGGSSSSSSSGGSDGGRVGVLGQLQYSAYCEASYDDVWEHYAWHKPLPWWFPLDFGKVNSSYAWDHEEHAKACLVGIYETSSAAGLQQLALRYDLPQRLVRQVGAPETLWTVISCPAAMPADTTPPSAQPGSSTDSSKPSSSQGSSSVDDDGALHVSVVWQEKTPTRIPEALWFSFRPASSAVDASSWRLHKLSSIIDPHEVMLNGSRSMHAVADEGVSVTSAAGDELLQIKTLDTALVSPGRPTPLPQGLHPPDMREGVHFNLVNQAWGTNYVMWVPYSTQDRSMAFRFAIQARKLHQGTST